MGLKTRNIGYYLVFIAILAVFVLSSAVGNASDLVFGPVTCQRGTGAPTVYNYSFAAPEPARGFILKAYNGGLEDTTYELISSSTVTLNGAEILGPSNFSQKVTYLEIPVSLQAQNTLNVEVRGKPGGALVLKLFPLLGIDAPTAGQLFNMQPVTVAGHLNSSVATVVVNGQPAAISGQTFTATGVSLAEGNNTLTATATLFDGRSGSDSVAVVLDTQPPLITISNPPEGLITNQPVELQFTVSDLQDPNPRVVVSPPTPYTADGAYQVNITATDAAGNSGTATRDFVIDTTPPAVEVTVPRDGATVNTAAVDVVGTVNDPTATITVNGVAAVVSGNTFTATGIALLSGDNTLFVVARDRVGNSSSTTVHVSDAVPNPAPTAMLTAVPTSVQLGASATLTWTTTEAQTCSIDKGVGTVPCNGSQAVTPSGTTTYTLTAVGQGGTVAAQAAVSVVAGAPVARLSAMPNFVPSGYPVSLSWSSTNATTCSINNGIGAVACSGSRVVTPAVTTTYVLSAAGPGGTITDQSTVTVAGGFGPPVNIVLNAAPQSIPLGTSSVLSWNASAGGNCAIDNGIGPVSCSGGRLVSPAATTTYTFTVVGPWGPMVPMAVKTTVTVTAPLPAVTIAASPQEMPPGGSTTLSWSSTNAESCSISGIGAVPLSGTLAVSPTETTTYQITATGQTGSKTSQVVVTVKYPTPTVTITATPSAIIAGQSATLSWSSTNAAACSIEGIGVVPITGTMIVRPEHSKIYEVAATGLGGTVTASAIVLVSYPVPTVSIAVTPDSIMRGNSALLSWNSTNVDSCVISGLGSVALSGTMTVAPSASSSYTITASGPGGTATDQALLTVSTPAPVVSLTASPEKIAQGESSTLSWSASDASYCSIEGVGSVACAGNRVVTPAATTTYRLAATGAGGTTQTQVKVTVEPPPVNVSMTVSPSTIHIGESATLSWSASGVTGSLMNQGIGLVGNSGAKVVRPSSTTEYVLTGAGAQGVSQASATLTVLGNPQPQPDGSFGARYQGQTPQDATVTAYDAKRFSLVTGTVHNRNDQPVAGVRVMFLANPQYGTAITNDEGNFTLPVEGGGSLTISYKKPGYLTTHRQVDVPWNDIAVVETIVMIPEDLATTKIAFNGDAGTVMVHQSTVETDEYGSRSAAIVFTGDNMAYAIVDEGEIQLSTLAVRATEFDTPNSMPAKLPPTSAYSYCVDLSVDGAKEVRFDKPVTVYVDNFLGFDVGEIVPAGFYDRNKGVWMSSDNGVVVRLLDTNGDGVVDALDTVGDGQSHDTDVAGLTDPTTFRPNSTYWQVKVRHFTPWDFNWAWYGPILNGIQPNPDGNPVLDQQQRCDGIDLSGSYCEHRSRILHEDIPVAGTDMSLHYSSNRVPGYKTTVTIPASGPTIPESLTRIIVRMEIAGRVFQTTLPPAPNQKVDFSWDGLDYLGMPVVGTRTARVSIGFGYIPVYASPRRDLSRAWAEAGNTATSIRGREERIEWKNETLDLQRDGSAQLAEGWTLPVYHSLSSTDPGRLYKGDGTIVDNNANIISTVVGNGLFGFSGDGGPATQAKLANPEGVAVSDAGNIYFADTMNHRIRKVDASGIITTVAGNGSPGFSGDGEAATQARLYYPSAVTVDSTDSLYIADYETPAAT